MYLPSADQSIVPGTGTGSMFSSAELPLTAGMCCLSMFLPVLLVSLNGSGQETCRCPVVAFHISSTGVLAAIRVPSGDQRATKKLLAGCGTSVSNCLFVALSQTRTALLAVAIRLPSGDQLTA